MDGAAPLNADEQTDVLIAGSGAGGLAAALLVRSRGLDVTLIEAAPRIGGTTALSAGGLWIPHNPLMQRDGVADSVEDALRYLNAVCGDIPPAATAERQAAYVHGGIRALQFLIDQGLRFQRMSYPDYYAEAPGGHGWPGRMVAAPAFDARRLGGHRDRVQPRPPLPLGLIPDSAADLFALLHVAHSWAARGSALRLLLRSLARRLRGMRPLVLGAAHVGQLLHAALRAGVHFQYETAAQSLLVSSNGAVTGLVARQAGRDFRLHCRRGVLLNAGGISHDRELREHHGPHPASTAWTATVPTHDGTAVRMAMAMGAAATGLDLHYWTPVAVVPGTAPINAGALGGGMIIELERHLPHSIIVDANGTRFANEAVPYMEFGTRWYAHAAHARALPAWLILDSRHRRRYPLGPTPPRITPRAWLSGGFMHRADSLRALARACGISPTGLEAGVARFNRMALSGVDEDFRRGETIYDRIFSDPRAGPNPCLGPIGQPPFYAVPLHPGDVGCAGGLVTDAHARVLRASDDQPIPGLYACGTTAASAMGGFYPGGGIAVGQSLVFGYLAAEHLCAASPAAADRP